MGEEVGSKFTRSILRNLDCIYGIRIAISNESFPTLKRIAICCPAYLRIDSPV